MFERLERQGVFLGYAFEDAGTFCFFGSRNVAKDDLSLHFPQFDFAFLKQVHGREVVEASRDRVFEADGHFTSRIGLALVSQTADCIPVLLSGPGFVCALHAGWRGVALNIVAAASEKLAASPANFAAIGPHIRRASFEVGQDVAEQLLRASPFRSSQSDFVYASGQTGKVHFDLTALAKAQLHESFGLTQPLDPGDDTKTSAQFHSFRRDRERAGRQYSFVVLKG